MEWYDINRSKVTTWMFAASHFEGPSNGIPKQMNSKETVYLSLCPPWWRGWKTLALTGFTHGLTDSENVVAGINSTT
jgi:hypothetical protein